MSLINLMFLRWGRDLHFYNVIGQFNLMFCLNARLPCAHSMCGIWNCTVGVACGRLAFALLPSLSQVTNLRIRKVGQTSSPSQSFLTPNMITSNCSHPKLHYEHFFYQQDGEFEFKIYFNIEKRKMVIVNNWRDTRYRMY